MINLSVAFLVSSGDYGSTGGERRRRASVDFPVKTSLAALHTFYSRVVN
jgi:hypothetical protein